MAKGKLFLIPTVIAEGTQQHVIPPLVIESLKGLQHFLAEDVRTARRYLSSLKIYESIERLDFKVLNKDTQEKELKELFAPILEDKNLAIL